MMVCNQPTRLTQPCIPPGSLNRVPASAGGKGWNVTSTGWQVTLCDPIWHVSSSSGEACRELLYPVTLLLYFTKYARFWCLTTTCGGCREDIGGRVLSVPDVRRERPGVPRPARHLPGHGSTARALLHQLQSQHVPLRSPVRRKVLGRDVPTSAVSRMQVWRVAFGTRVLFPPCNSKASCYGCLNL